MKKKSRSISTSKETETGYVEEEVPPGGEYMKDRVMWAEIRDHFDIFSIVPSSVNLFVP